MNIVCIYFVGILARTLARTFLHCSNTISEQNKSSSESKDRHWTDMYGGPISFFLHPPPQLHSDIKIFQPFISFLSLDNPNPKQYSTDHHYKMHCAFFFVGGGGGIQLVKVCIWTYWKIILENDNGAMLMMFELTALPYSYCAAPRHNSQTIKNSKYNVG
jgi:hypothetical protein